MNDVDEILTNCKTVAIVGLSPKADRPSYNVAQYLKEHGWCIVPVNPATDQILGERCYPDLASIPGPVDAVDIFRRSEDVPPIVDAAIKKGAKAVWMQEGVVNEKAAEKARKAGLWVVMDRCIKREHMHRKAG